MDSVREIITETVVGVYVTSGGYVNGKLDPLASEIIQVLCDYISPQFFNEMMCKLMIVDTAIFDDPNDERYLEDAIEEEVALMFAKFDMLEILAQSNEARAEALKGKVLGRRLIQVCEACKVVHHT
jgi:hypothetical protein